MGLKRSRQKEESMPGEQHATFAAHLRQALEHVNDPEWLSNESPLESMAALLAAELASAPPAPPDTGNKSRDLAVQAIAQAWQAHPKSKLQTMLWSAIRSALPNHDPGSAELLLLTYFQDPRPKQADLIKALALGQSTFYRQLNTAVQALERVLLSELRPSLRLEWPVARSLIGRDELKLDVLAALRDGGFVNLVGASGLGKTSLGASIAHTWGALGRAMADMPAGAARADYSQHPSAFWYTFRPGLTDNLQQLTFAIALFLHQLGASSLWTHLVTKPEDLGPVKIMAMIRKGLEDLRHVTLPLFCFDEVDLLLPGDPDDNEDHSRLRAWLEEFVKMPRGGAPVLFIGQRLLMEPEPGRMFRLEPFGIREVGLLFQRSGIEAGEAAQEAVLSYTHGNPLLTQLLVTLHQMGESVIAHPPHLSSSLSMDWLLARLRQRLSDKERDLLDAISVFDAPAPAGIWRRQARTLERLAQLNLIEHSPADEVAIPSAFRDALYRRLTSDARAVFHVEAAQALAERGAFTRAAHHFAQGQQPEMAVWTWHNHREQEIRQGQAQTALRILEPLRFASLAHEKDRQALSLVLAELYHLLGRHEDGLDVLAETRWPSNRRATLHAHTLRGKLLAMRGDIDAALAEYRASLDGLVGLSPAKPIALRVELAQQTFWRARETDAARREALLAQQDVEMLLGDIEAEAGHMDNALAHYHAAADSARQTNDPVRLAKVNESLAILEARRLNVHAARQHLDEAGRHYRAYGNLICAVGVTKTNLAYAYLLARQYRDAIPPAEEAIAFFTDVNQPYWLSLNEANLAEAHASLGNTRAAEEWAWRALAREETAVRPYCLYVLGIVRRLQRQLEQAEQFCNDALASASANGDRWAAAPAWRVLGEIYRDWGRLTDARSAFDEALRWFTQQGVAAEVNWLRDAIAALNP